MDTTTWNPSPSTPHISRIPDSPEAVLIVLPTLPSLDRETTRGFFKYGLLRRQHLVPGAGTFSEYYSSRHSEAAVWQPGSLQATGTGFDIGRPREADLALARRFHDSPVSGV
jgi:hypothetical protein